MFDNVNNVSFGKDEPKETKKSFFRKTNEMPNDSVELSSAKQKSSLAEKLAMKILEKVAHQKDVIEQKQKVSPMQIYQNMIKDGISKSSAKKITGDSTLLKQYILFTSSEKDEDGNLISGLKKPLKTDVAVRLISDGIDETQIKKAEMLLDFNIPTYEIHQLINNEPFMRLISDEVDENGELLSGLPKVPTSNDIHTLKKYSADEIEKFKNLVSRKKDETGKLASGLTRAFKIDEAMDFIKKATASASPQLYIDLIDNDNSYSYNANKIISDDNLQQRLYMLCGDEKAKQTSTFSQKFDFSEAMYLIDNELTDEQIEIYIQTPKEKHDNGIYYYGRYPVAGLIKNGFKEKESFQMLSVLDSDYHYRDYISHYYPIITPPKRVKLFSLLTNTQKDEKTGKYLSGCIRELNEKEATKICISLKYPDEQLPQCIQLINLGVSINDATDIVATKYYNEEERDRFADFMSFISDEKDENGKLKSGLEETLSIENATFIVKERIPYEHISLFTEMANDGLNKHKIKYFFKSEDSCTRYKELRANTKSKNNSLSPSEAYTIVENKIEDSQIAKFVELTREESALALGLKRGLTLEEASSVVKEDISTEQIPLFLEIMSDEKDENGNLKSGLKNRIEWTDVASRLVKKGYSKEQIIRFSEVYLLRFGFHDCVQFYQAEDIVEHNLNDEEVKRYLKFCEDDCFNTRNNIYDHKTEEDRKNFKMLIFDIVKDPEKFERYKSLTDENNNKVSLPSLVAVRFVAPEICSDNQIEFYKRIDYLYRDNNNPFIAIDCAKNKDNYEKYCHYTTNFEVDINGEKRPLTKDEAVHAIYNGVSEENIPTYIRLLKENGKFYSTMIAKLVKKNISSSEQIKLYRTMMDFGSWLRNINEEQVIDILSNPEKLERYKLITSSELDSHSLLLNSVNQTFKKNDNAKLKSGLKRALQNEEAIDFLSPKVINNKRINEYLSIVDTGVNSAETRAVFSDDEKYNKYSVLISNDKNPNGTLKSGLTRPLNPKEAIEIVESDIDISQIEFYLELINFSISKDDAIKFVKNTEFMEQYKTLTSTEKDTSGLKRSLKAIEFYEVTNNKLDIQQTKFLIELADENIPIRDVVSVLKDEKKYQKLLHYSSKEVDETGKLKNKLPRPLTIVEAYKVSDKKLNTSQISKYINLSKNNLPIDTAIVLAKDFGFLNGQNNINELSLQEKRKFLKALISNNSALYNLKLPFGEFEIIPTKQKEYCKTLDKLAKSIGIDTRELNSVQKSTCYDGLKEITSVITSSNIDNCEISLDFSREEFLSETQSILSKLNSLEQRKVMDYFGFEIKHGKLIGYPINVNNGEKLKEIENEETKAVVEELRPIVQRFSVDNKIHIPQDKNLEESLNKILEGLPELKTLVGKAQHETQDYTLDKHTLKVLQNVVQNPNFESLSDNDKRIITIATLFHDIAKAEGVVDKAHPVESAFDAFYIIQKFNLSEDEQLKLYQLIKTHDWLEKLNKTQENSDKLAKDIAFNMRHSNTFELSKILCEADLKSVKADESFWTHFKDAFVEKSQVVQNYLDILEKSKIVLPQTKIPKASEMQNVETRTANGITNKVLCIGHCDNDLSQYGFEQGTTVKNWKGLVHALDYETQLRNFDTFSIVDSDALLSTSYMNPKEYHVFRKQGLILDVNSSDIHAGYYRDFGSGYTKNLELLQNDYLFGGSRQEYRTYISKLIKNELNLNDAKYVELLKKIEGCKSITDVEKIDSEFASVLQNVFDEMDSGKRSYGRQYNEMLVSRPKIQGVFSYGQNYEDIPLFLRKYAQDNDLPIIMFGHYQ